MGRGGKGRPLFQSDADRDVVAIAWAKGGCKRTSSELEAGAFMPTRVGLGASAGRPAEMAHSFNSCLYVDSCISASLHMSCTRTR